jgi:hypothetical protein
MCQQESSVTLNQENGISARPHGHPLHAWRQKKPQPLEGPLLPVCVTKPSFLPEATINMLDGSIDKPDRPNNCRQQKESILADARKRIYYSKLMLHQAHRISLLVLTCPGKM